MAYLLRDDNIIWDAISPQDVIIADLKKGCYATLSGLGAEFLWQRLITPYSLTNLFTDCRTYFKQFTKQDEQKIQQIIAELVDQDVLMKATFLSDKEESVFSYPAVPFEAFKVEHIQYADMQTLLQLDPIDNILED